ncbi:Hypothetical protein ADU72_1686 [Pediococcus damnosus]|uniref:Uncharacterized protein n=1 Tax=Pediococcus damnosus TaxID=51663 RepID=A0AAC9FIM9_9LACO|nr:hypothetical protein [Pediococcus damnosus]AMV59974.1 Hypothetical protein ADU69_0296 [Pediococcus damnosus]AMV62512.1 Hypothetical protein ADU70_1018 [Pediococcus damnosus]AMV64217.1 Hypothetical protein ADU71_0294 [Pediococcus damnosus]AMV67611.1 Hypothetical protein ADU72_1686 [Pediococcus damnosus]AMV69046.1 Hypothetical protein ADU73_0638 [Pediococcus damnosus]
MEHDLNDINFSDDNHEVDFQAASLIKRNHQLLICETSSSGADFVFVGVRTKSGKL